MILSTHSWELLSDKGIAGEEVLLLTPTLDGTQSGSQVGWAMSFYCPP
ncbi:hypothetical protein BGP_3509 [Beggiatoa sp. PS]|nr:hypothetical protein BGP_3509 [Beggiatoa sp. PS]